jgi:hypothetical protein
MRRAGGSDVLEHGYRSAHATACADLRQAAPASSLLLSYESGKEVARKEVAEFERTRNDYWLYAENTGTTQALVRMWLARRRSSFDAETASAEGTFAMGGIVSRHAESELLIPLLLFGKPWMTKALDRWLASEQGVPSGSSNEQVTLTVRARGSRVPLDDSLAGDLPSPEKLLSDRGVRAFPPLGGSSKKGGE